MRRRKFILGFAAGAALRPVAGIAQTAPPPVIVAEQAARTRPRNGSRARKIGLLVNPGNPGNAAQRSNVEAGAATLGIELIPLQARVPDDLHGAFENMAREKVAMVLTLADAMLLNERKRIALLAAAARLPTMFGFRQHVEDGGLMSYGIELRESWRRSAGFVGKILKGAKPGDLPIEFPTKLELVINLTTAKVLGLNVPPTLLARADEVIE